MIQVMKTIHRSLTAWAGLALLISVTYVSAQDWPQWRGVNRDGKTAGFKVPQKWPETLTQKWKVTVGTGDATPALVGDKLYVFARQGEEEILSCLNLSDGKELWQNKYTAQAVTGAAARHPGPRSCPAVADGKVVTMGVGGVVSCVDAATGKELWRKDEFPKVVPQFFTAMSPIIVDGLCVAHVGAKENSAMVAFDLTTGDVKWKWTGDGPAYGSPVLMTVDGVKQIVQQAEKTLVSVAVADGKKLWQIDTPIQGRVFNSATPIVDGTTVIYTGQGKGTKAVKVEKQGDAFTTRELWSNDQVGTGYNTPTLKDGLLFGISDKGNIFCLDSKTGQTAWTDTTKRENFSSVVDAGSVIIALSEKSGLVVFSPSKTQYEQLAQFKVSENPIYAHPIPTGNKIIVKDSDTVTLWSVE
jgi:outer membrane protein assembly factor BamB